MKKILNLPLTVALLLAATPLASMATVFFTDNFTSGSTTNGPSIPGGTPTASYTSYDVASSKNATNGPAAAGHFPVGIAATSAGGWEVQALFATNAVSLTFPGDYIQIAVVFTDSNGLLGGGSTSASSGIWLGLFNSGFPQNLPLAGTLELSGLSTAVSSPYATGNCANWQGYVCQILNSNSQSRILTRPLQNGATTTSASQDLLGSGVGSGYYVNPAGTIIGTNTTTFGLANGSQYTMVMSITLTNNNPNFAVITNTLYSGAGTGGAVLYSMVTSTNQVTGGTFLTSGFDGLAIGAFNKGTPTFPAVMDINSIVITGVSTPVTNPPTIDTQPLSATVPSGGSCAFSVAATGFNVSYQWHRHGTNLINGPNISGATSSQLIISPAGSADVATAGADGYYVTVTGTGPYSTNSITNSLTLGTANALTWSGNGTVWDLNASANWVTNNVQGAFFNFGDSVIFDNYAVDVGAANLAVTLAGSYLSASSVTVNNPGGYDYSFQGTGSFAGPGSLLYEGAGLLTMNNANSYSGGTTISNANANLILNNYGALGTGPVTLAKAGGKMEISNPGSASTGINGDVIVADDFVFLLDSTNTFACVLFGNLSGTSGKTLTVNLNHGGNPARVRTYGTNTVYNANLNLNNSQVQLAFYQGGGNNQAYNGLIYGSGSAIQRGNGTTYLNYGNTYTGGTIPSAGAIGFGLDSTPTSGTVTAGPIGTGPLYLQPEFPNTTGSGQVFASGGARTIANPLVYASGTNNQTLIVGGTNALTFTSAINLAGADGLDNNSAFMVRYFQVTNTALTTLSGVISDLTNSVSAGFGLGQLGNGILVLNNTETYTGPTVISNGTIQVNGSLAAASVVTVATNGNLGGTGTIAGPVTIQQGGALAPGAASVGGQLIINNNLSIAGNVKVRVNRSGSVSDNANVSLTLANSGTGTVYVTNKGTAFQPGDTFALFNKLVTGGATMKVIGGGVGWTNQLALNGTIKVTSTNPPTVSAKLDSGTNIIMNWSVDYAGWILQSNAVSLISNTNWFTVLNSGNATSFTNTVNTAKTNGVYFRLIAPY